MPGSVDRRREAGGDPAAAPRPEWSLPASPGLRRTCAALLLAALVVRIAIGTSAPVTFDEAYYWEWSRFPALGYLDHPPLVAWILMVVRAVAPDGSLAAVRSPAWVLGAVSCGLVYLLGRLLFRSERVGLRALLILLGMPVVTLVGTLMVPDAPLLLFHLLTTLAFAAAIQRGGAGYWLLAGGALGLALLSKFQALLTGTALGLFLCLSVPHRHWLRRPEPYAALGIAAAVWSPFLWWNARHEWASFALQFRDAPALTFGFGPERVPEYLFEQLANSGFLLFLPVLGALLVPQERFPPAHRPACLLMKCQAWTVLLVFLAVGAVSETHPHWTLLAYPPAAVLLAALWTAEPHRWPGRAGRTAAAACIGLTLVLGAGTGAVLAFLDALPPAPFGPVPRKKIVTAQERLFGFSRLAASLKGGGRLFALTRQEAAILSFHHGGPPVVNMEAFLHRGARPGGGQWYYLPRDSLLHAEGAFVGRVGPPAGFFAEVGPAEETEGVVSDEAGPPYRLFRVRGVRPDRIRDSPGRTVAGGREMWSAW